MHQRSPSGEPLLSAGDPECPHWPAAAHRPAAPHPALAASARPGPDLRPQPGPDERTLTELDHTRVGRLLARSGHEADGIRELLDTSDVVPSPAVPGTVVTMNSRVLLQDERDGSRSEVTLCYPAEADPAAGQLSVLSPAGAALLGLQAGAVARWQTPGGEERALRVVALLFQPEAAGDYLR